MWDEIVKYNGKFKYLDIGYGQPIVLLYGLFGDINNYSKFIPEFSKRYRIILPVLPIHDLGMFITVNSLATYVDDLLNLLNIQKANIIGNSLGGHIAIIHTLNHPEKVNSLTLVGSSGLFENGMGDTFPKRGNYEYIKQKAESTFLKPHHASKELVDKIFSTVNDRIKVLQILSIAKSTIKQNLSEEIKTIQCPTLIVWGKQDIVTPPIVAEQFHKSILNSALVWIDQCGHVPMIETPEAFNRIYKSYITNLIKQETILAF